VLHAEGAPPITPAALRANASARLAWVEACAHPLRKGQVMLFFYSSNYTIPVPEGHRFPSGKYRLLHEALLADGTVLERQLCQAAFASRDDICAAHERAYVSALLEGTIGEKEQRQIGLPWRQQLVNGVLATIGGAVEATKAALQAEFSALLAAGTHHAHAGFGSGYCLLNDFAIVAMNALREGWADRIAIVDLDVHQSDGNASLLGRRNDVYIPDLYCKKNFPFRKVAPHLSVPLEPGPTDKAYLAALADVLPAVLSFRPDLVLYRAGVDPLHHDCLGHLALSYEGLAARDEMVLGACYKAGTPVSLAIGGGYANPISLSVKAYANTFRVAKKNIRILSAMGARYGIC
jgi:acetoin utilization deacetylase AcuC-like enzyme